MVEEFEPEQQRPGSNSCLPTAIRAILRYYGRDVTQSQISNWCQEGPDGCVIDLAMDGLCAQDWDVIEPTDGPETEIRQYVNDENEPTPVLVTIKPAFSDVTDHAVAVLGVGKGDSGNEEVTFMDPLTGRIEALNAELFFLQMDNAGQLAFVIQG